MMKRHGFTVLELIIVLLVIGIVAAILFPMFFARSRESDHPSPGGRCQNDLKQIAIGIKQYIQDNDERFPIVSVYNSRITANRPYGWADAIQPYIKSIQVYQCPSETNGTNTDPTQSGYTDYWYNNNLRNMDEGKLAFISNTILAGDGNDGIDLADARYAKSGLPAGWMTDASKPSFRHLKGANYAFADGHVKWLKPEKITTNQPDAYTYTFAVK